MRRGRNAAIILAIVTTLAAPTTCHAEEVEIPEDIQRYCEEVGEEYSIAPELLEALCWQETRCKVRDNITQITNPKWFKEGIEATKTTNLKSPKQNIRVCAYYLKQYFELGTTEDEYGEQEADVYLVLEAWNEGPENALRNYNPNRPSYYARKVVEISEQILDQKAANGGNG